MSTKKEKSDNVKYEEQNLSMITKELRNQTKDLEKQIKANAGKQFNIVEIA